MITLQGYITDVQSVGFKSESLRAIFRKAHDLKGQAGTFGYGLVTEISASLCTLVRKMLDNPSHIELRKLALITVISMHIDAIGVCASQNITGDGSSDGGELLKTLRSAVKRISAGLEPVY